MKATELFVGALVCAESPSGICEVKEILSDYWTDTKGIRHDYERTEPITLTANILIFNGFKLEVIQSHSFTDKHFYYHWNSDPITPSKGLWLYVDGEDGKNGFRFSKLLVKYVHQLQNLLKFLGYDKSIKV